jgi:hypothetical protein
MSTLLGQWIHVAFTYDLTTRIRQIYINGIAESTGYTIGLTSALEDGLYTLDYNYMILANVSLESMPRLIKQYDEEQVFACISNNGNFQGIVWSTLKYASFVLWDDNVTTFSCNSQVIFN